MTQCDAGHFYDKEQKSAGCPFCGVGAPDITKEFSVNSQKDDDRTRASTASDGSAGDADRTVAVWARAGGIDSPVGYLICTEGANQGRDYRIRSGYNNIGRDTSQQICIVGDDLISRVEHAKIFYDPKNATFHVMPGGGRSAVHVNGQLVVQPVLLKAYDVLEIGSTMLTFLPLCGEHFRWTS
jgi:hypothetical protein